MPKKSPCRFSWIRILTVWSYVLSHSLAVNCLNADPKGHVSAVLQQLDVYNHSTQHRMYTCIGIYVTVWAISSYNPYQEGLCFHEWLVHTRNGWVLILLILRLRQCFSVSGFQCGRFQMPTLLSVQVPSETERIMWWWLAAVYLPSAQAFVLQVPIIPG